MLWFVISPGSAGSAHQRLSHPFTRIHTPLGRVALFAGFIVVALTVYQGALQDRLSSDARFLTYQNEFVRDPGGLAKVWTSDFFEGAITHGVPYRSGYYRPVTNTIFWLEYRVAGDRDLLYHVNQVLLHSLIAFLVVLFCLRLSPSLVAAGIAGLFFLLHPVHAFAATEPAARADAIFLVFYLLALLTFDSALQEPTRRAAAGKVAGTVVLYLLSVLSKEMGITLPAVLVILALYRHFADDLPWRRVARTIPVWVALVAYLVWRFGLLELPGHALGYAETYPRLVLVIAAVKGIVIHLARIVLPVGADYPELHPGFVNFVGAPFTDPTTYVALVVVVSLAVIALRWKWNPYLAFWSGFFLLTYSPLLRVDNIAGTLGLNVILTQERWIYLPSIALAAVLGHGFAKLIRAFSGRIPRAAFVAAGVVVFLFLGRAAAVHASSYNDPFARLRRLYLLPEDRLSPMERANKLLLYAQWVAVPMGDIAEAEDRARRAVSLVPASPISAAALADILIRAGKWDEVIEVLAPWRAPSFDELLRFQETNVRVGDDLNRVNPQIALMLARAYAHIQEGREAMALLCESVAKDIGDERVVEALREAYALNGPPQCAMSGDPGACMAGVSVPTTPEWTPPFGATSCPVWVNAIQP